MSSSSSAPLAPHQQDQSEDSTRPTATCNPGSSSSCPNGNPRNASQNERDMENLGDAVMDVLLEFQTVTGMEDLEESRRILDAHNWDLISAISAHMGFEAVPQHVNYVSHPTTSGSSTSSSSDGSGSPGGFSGPSSSLRHRNIPPTLRAQSDESTVRLIERRDRSINGGGGGTVRNLGIFGMVWKLITAPVQFFFGYLWDFISVGLRFLQLQADPRRAITDPIQDVTSFIANYEAKYGTDHPVFYQGTYGQALSDAKKELKFLLVYLHSEEHVDTDAFCRTVLTHQDFRDLIQQNMLFWACSVTTPEGYRTSQALRENTYPFLALIVLKNNRMTIVARVEGCIDPERVTQRFQQAVADNEIYLIAERQDRLERSQTQTLRQEQDAAYLESLRKDQEKEKKKKEELEKRKQEEMEKLRIIQEELDRREALKQEKIRVKENLKAEPDTSNPDTIRIIIKLPNGTRLERRFLKQDSLKHLYDFVFSNSDAPDSFEIATNFPKRTLPCKPTGDTPDPPSFIQAGLGRNEMLFVYDLEA